jgi:uncharacterized protein with GYD domain
MATYLMLFSFTQQGIEKIKQLGTRVEDARKAIRQMGGELKTFYTIMGSKYDTLFILTAPNDEKVAQMALAIAKLGNVRTQTHRLFSEEEINKITASLP